MPSDVTVFVYKSLLVSDVTAVTVNLIPSSTIIPHTPILWPKGEQCQGYSILL